MKKLLQGTVFGTVLFLSASLFSQVTVTPPTVDLCATTPGYVTIPDISIVETAATDIDSSAVGSNTDTLTLKLSIGFEFNPAMTPGLNINSGTDISGFTVLYQDTDSLALAYTVDTKTSIDNLSLTGLEVSTTADNTSGTLSRNGGDAVFGGAPTLFANLNALEIPAVTNASTTEAICDGATASGFALTSDVGGATFSWTTSPTNIDAGFTTSGLGNITGEALSLTSATTDGSLVYTATAYNSGCAGLTQDFTITVNADPSIIDPGLTICHGENTGGSTITSTVAGATYTWTASDNNLNNSYTTSGSNATIPDETLTVDNAGASFGTLTYNVTATNGACVANDNLIITVGEEVNSPLNITTGQSDTIVVCERNGVNYTFDNSANVTEILWYLTGSGDANITSATNQNNVVVDYGLQSDTLTLVQGYSGCQDTTKIPVEIFGCNFIGVNDNDDVCEGEILELAIDSLPDITPTFNWFTSGSNAIILGENDESTVSVGTNGSGTVNISFGINYNGGYYQIDKTIDIQTLPSRLDISGPSTILCGEQDIPFTATGGTGPYIWRVFDPSDFVGYDTSTTSSTAELDFNNNVSEAYVSVREESGVGCVLEEAGQALNFTGGGGDAYNIEKDEASGMNSSEGSVLMWVRTPNDWTGSYDGSGIIYYGSENGTNGYGENSNAITEFTLAIRENRFVFDISQDADNNSLDLQSDPINENTWYHLAITWNSAGDMRMYVDIASAADAPQQSAAYGTKHSFNFIERHRFGRGFNDERRFVGEIDNVSLWTTELSNNQIFQYKNQSAPPQDGLYAYYPFDPEDPLADASGNGYTLSPESVSPTYEIATYFSDVKKIAIDAFEFNVGEEGNTKASAPYDGKLFFETIGGKTFNIINYNWTGSTYDGLDTAKLLNTGTFLELTATNSANCQFTASNTVTGAIGLDAGEIESSRDPGNFISSYCEGYELPLIDNVTAASGGVGSITYTWQYSFNNSTWFDFASSNSESFQVSILQTENVYIRRKAEDQSVPPEEDFSNSVFFIETTRDPLAASFGTDTSICNNADPYTLTIAGASGGSTGFWVEDSNYVNSGGLFIPDSTMGGNSYLVTYIQDKLGCADTLDATINIYTIQNTTLDVPDGELTTGSGDQAITFTPSAGVGSNPDTKKGLFYMAEDINDVFNNQINTLPISDREIVPDFTGTSAILYPDRFDNSLLGESGFWIGYEHTDNNGCVTQALDSIIIIEEPGSISDRIYVCEYETLFSKEAIGDNSRTLINQSLSTYSGYGLENVVTLSDRMVFDYNATLVPDSIHTDTIYYQYTYNIQFCFPSCFDIPVTSTIQQTMNIVRFDSMYVETSPGILDTSYCIDEAPFFYTVNPSPSSGNHQRFFSSNLTTSGRLSTSINTYDPQNNIKYTPGRFNNGGVEELTYTYQITNFDNTTSSNKVCDQSINFDVIVQELPEPEIYGLVDSLIYCSNSNNIKVTGNYSNQGDFAAPVSNGFLFPNILDDTTYVSYTYTNDTTGCSNTKTDTVLTFQKPSVSIKGLDDFFCVDNNDGPYLLEGVVFTPDSTFGLNNGVFTGTGINDLDEDSEYDFSPIDMGVGENQPVTYTYVDGNGCVGDTTLLLSIKPLPQPYVELTYNPTIGTALKDGNGNDYICSYDGATINVDGFPAPTSNPVDDGFLTIRGATNGTSSGTFLLNNNDFGNQTITYDYTDSLGCYNVADTTFFVHETPIGRFGVINRCISDTIFIADSTVMRHPEELIRQWTVYYDDSEYGPFDTENNDTINHAGATPLEDVTLYHFYSEEGFINPTMRITTEFGCVDNAAVILEAGESQILLNKDPEANFVWFNECYEVDSIRFTNTSDQGSLDDPATQYKWTITQVGFEDSVKTKNGVFLLEDEAIYDVNLLVTSNEGCKDDTTKQIKTRPYYNTVDEIETLVDFDANGSRGWDIDTVYIDNNNPASESYNNNWELGSPSKNFFESAYSGTNAYFTKLNGNYSDESRSYITSGCYDLTALERPMIKMQIISLLNQNDGVVFQYSLDTGKTWTNLGSLIEDLEAGTFQSTGIKWFNSNNIAAEPNADDRTGWTSRTRNENGVTDWVSARHSLSEITDQSVVRFRFAFASNTNSPSDGFGFDDIFIGNRTRLVLGEHFVNTNDASNNTYGELINFMGRRSDPVDIIDINYATNVQVPNIINGNAVGQKEVDYGYPNTLAPYTVMDGNVFLGSSENWLKDSTDTDLRSLEDAAIEIAHNNFMYTGVDNTSISIDIDLLAIDTIPNERIRLKGAVIETIADVVPFEGADTVTIRNLMRNVLGSIAGTSITNLQSEGDFQNFTLTADISNVADTNNLALVIYVQDEDTEEVLQAYFVEAAVGTVPTPLIDIVNAEEYKYILFPNPAISQTNIVFDSELKDDYDVTIVDNLGNIVEVLTMESGSRALNINTQNYASGLYILYISNEEQVLAVEKLVIQK